MTIPAAEIEGRIARFQAALRAAELDGALVVQETDLVYLAGTGQSAHLVVPAEGEPALYVRKTFERAREAKHYPGTGIGLAILAKAIERMNGRFGVESEPGAGSDRGSGTSAQRRALQPETVPQGAGRTTRDRQPGAL